MSRYCQVYRSTTVSRIIPRALAWYITACLLAVFDATAVAQSCPNIDLRCPTGEAFSIGSCFRDAQCQPCNDIKQEIQDRCPTPYPNRTQAWLNRDDGCSVPTIGSASTQIFEAPRAIHDMCSAGPQGKNMCDEQIETNMKAICSLPGAANIGSTILSRISPVPDCEVIAGSFHLALLSAPSAGTSYDNSQQFRIENDSQATSRSRNAKRYLIRQSSSGRYLDAYESQGRDYAANTRPVQANKTQTWVLTEINPNLQRYRIQQYSSGRYLDAYRTEERDFGVRTRRYQTGNTQVWELSGPPDSHSTVTIRQVGARGNAGYLDAYQSNGRDFGAATRPSQQNATQQWVLTEIR